MPTPTTETDTSVTIGAEAIRALNRRLHERDGDDYRASPEDLAQAVLSTIPQAILEAAPLYSLNLDHLDREDAHFAAAGGFSLKMHRGEWMERGRPSRIWITVQEPDALSAP